MNRLSPRNIPEIIDDLVITCIDHRFHGVIRERLQDQHNVDLDKADRIAWPGSSKAVADGTLIPAVRTSHRLHNIKNIWLVDHQDCGGFGGLAAYNGDEHLEMEAHFESLERAANVIHKVLPELVVTSFVATLDGELTSAANTSP